MRTRKERIHAESEMRKFSKEWQRFNRHYAKEQRELSHEAQSLLNSYFVQNRTKIQYKQKATIGTIHFKTIVEINDFFQKYVIGTEFMNLYGLKEYIEEAQTITKDGKENGTFILEGMRIKKEKFSSFPYQSSMLRRLGEVSSLARHKEQEELPTEKEQFSIELWRNIESISLKSKMLYQINLDSLKDCKNLKFLSLLRNKLAKLDLSSLKECKLLEHLFLEENNLDFLDLTPLESCVHLQMLTLSANRLKEINLASLEKCSELKTLELDSNRLTKLNLAPLKNAKNLEYLSISKNVIQELDLSPLGSCERLTRLILDENQLKKLDLSPLAMCKNLETINLEKNYFKEVIDLTPLGKMPKLKLVYLTLPQISGGPYYTAQESEASVLRRVLRPDGPFGVVPKLKWIRKRQSEKYIQKIIPTINYRSDFVVISPCPSCGYTHRVRLKIVYARIHSEKERTEKFTRTLKCPQWNESFKFSFYIKTPPGVKVHEVEGMG